MAGRRVGLIVAITAAAAGVVTGCGGGASPSAREGDASAATAAYFVQERDGGRLPEGVGETSERGISGADIHPLAVDGEQKKSHIRARFCIEYRYQHPPTPEKARVYTAELVGNAWRVSAVNEDGTCDGVS